MAPQIRWEKLWNDPDGFKYKALNAVRYRSPRFNQYVTVPKGYKSDGATGAVDLETDAWGFHDVLCDRGTWDDGAELSNFTASIVLFDVLRRDGISLRRSLGWLFMTLWKGGGKCRENGLWKLKK